ncbi:MAG TPA: type II toxin-antitoxin system MqsA family antitoxin [Rhodothermales bacterium]|nr:type II toxin-antitoxin system MqsA family antitoxin [Rhodothermales bacterium]
MTTCVICKTGRLRPGTTSVMLERDGATVVVKNVPADVCDNCGEAYTSEEVTGQVLREAEDAIKRGAEVEVRHYHTAA